MPRANGRRKMVCTKSMTLDAPLHGWEVVGSNPTAASFGKRAKVDVLSGSSNRR